MSSVSNCDIYLDVPVEYAGKTVASVVKQMTGRSWSEVKRLLLQRHIAVNGIVCIEEARRVVAGERIRVSDRVIKQAISTGDVTVYYMDSELIVLEKPAGIVSLRHFREIDWPYDRRMSQPTLDEVALIKVGASLTPPQDLNRWPPRIRRQHIRAVHRIDRETSGLVVFARTLESEQNLISQFAAHTVERVYLTVCYGRVSDGTTKSFFIRDRGDGLRGSTLNEHEGKVAITHFRLVSTLKDHSLVECRLETGRTHQIRLHLTESGHPLCGDGMYRSGFQEQPRADLSGAKRLALHAHRLEFDHPKTGERLRFESPLPKDMADLLTHLRQS